jgi:IS30 family transposase
MPNKHKGSYRHLNQADRDRLQALRDAGTKQKEIAAVLKVDAATISREIARNRRKYRKKKIVKNKNARYEAGVAEHKAYVRRKYAKYQGKKIEENKELRRYIAKNLRRYWNPDEISGRMKKDHEPFYASKTAIYEWLRSVWGQAYVPYLYSGRYYAKKRGPKKPAKSTIPNRVSIHERPLSSEREYGHYEADTFVSGKRSGGKAAVSVAVERQADYIQMKKIERMRPKLFAAAVRKMRQAIVMKSATLDNGIENRDHETIGAATYFCDPYSSWQKPHVENAIRLVRRFIPKGTDIDKVPETKIARVARILNHKPRKSLGYQKPYEVMVEQNLFTKNAREKIALRG